MNQATGKFKSSVTIPVAKGAKKVEQIRETAEIKRDRQKDLGRQTERGRERHRDTKRYRERQSEIDRDREEHRETDRDK